MMEVGASDCSSEVRYICMRRWSWRRMAQRIEKRERMEGGKR